MSPALQEKIAARRSLPPVPLRQPLREAGGISRQDIADAVAEILTEEAGEPRSCTAQAVLYWERGKREPRGRYLIAYCRVLESLREMAT